MRSSQIVTILTVKLPIQILKLCLNNAIHNSKVGEKNGNLSIKKYF